MDRRKFRTLRSSNSANFFCGIPSAGGLLAAGAATGAAGAADSAGAAGGSCQEKADWPERPTAAIVIHTNRMALPIPMFLSISPINANPIL